MHLDPNRIRTCIANRTGLRFVALALIVLGCVVGNQVNAVEDRFPQMLDLLASTKASDNYRGCALAREVWTRQKGFNPIQVRQLLPILMAMVGDPMQGIEPASRDLEPEQPLKLMGLLGEPGWVILQNIAVGKTGVGQRQWYAITALVEGKAPPEWFFPLLESTESGLVGAGAAYLYPCPPARLEAVTALAQRLIRLKRNDDTETTVLQLMLTSPEVYTAVWPEIVDSYRDYLSVFRYIYAFGQHPHFRPEYFQAIATERTLTLEKLESLLEPMQVTPSQEQQILLAIAEGGETDAVQRLAEMIAPRLALPDPGWAWDIHETILVRIEKEHLDSVPIPVASARAVLRGEWPPKTSDKLKEAMTDQAQRILVLDRLRQSGATRPSLSKPGTSPQPPATSSQPGAGAAKQTVIALEQQAREAMAGDKTVAEHIHAYAAGIRTFSAAGLPWQSEWTAYVRAVLALRTTIVNLAALPTQTVRDQAATRAVADVQRRYATLVSAMGEVGGTLPADLPPILLSVLPPTDVAKP